MNYKLDDQPFEFEEIQEETEGKIDDYEYAFWDEFYSREEKEIPTLTIEEKEDQTTLIIKSKLPRLKTN